MEAFKNVKDEQLVSLLRAGDTAAEEELILRYTSYVRSFVRPYFLVGGDFEDLIQEGMIGVIKAIAGFDEAHHTQFKTYAVQCIRSRVYSAIRHSKRGKNSPLSNYVSIESPPEYPGEVESTALADSSLDPVELIISEEQLMQAYNSLANKR